VLLNAFLTEEKLLAAVGVMSQAEHPSITKAKRSKI